MENNIRNQLTEVIKSHLTPLDIEPWNEDGSFEKSWFNNKGWDITIFFNKDKTKINVKFCSEGGSRGERKTFAFSERGYNNMLKWIDERRIDYLIWYIERHL